MIASALLISAITLASVGTDTVSHASILQEIGAMVRVDTVEGPPGEGTVRVVGFNSDSKQPMPLIGSFMRAHGRLVWYLATHTPGAGARILTSRDNPMMVRDSVIAALTTNRTFTDRLFTMLANFRSAHGGVRTEPAGFTPRERIPVMTLTGIGARFFYPERFSPQGDTMFTHICAGINGIGDLPNPVDPLVEAFVFVAVNGSLFQPHSPLMRAFELSSKRAKLTSASKDTTTRVKRAQGALWTQLEQDPAMRRALTRTYLEHQAVLPFRVVSGS